MHSTQICVGEQRVRAGSPQSASIAQGQASPRHEASPVPPSLAVGASTIEPSPLLVGVPSGTQTLRPVSQTYPDPQGQLLFVKSTSPRLQATKSITSDAM